MGRLRERKIIATFVAFAGSGVVIIEVAHHILVNHYHLPQQIVDICIVTLVGALLGTLLWRWFRGSEKRPGNVKVEVLVVPLIILLTLVIDLKFIFLMTDISINMMLIGITALGLGIAWIIFKSLQWAANVPEMGKKVEVLKLKEEGQEAEPINFPEWKKSIVVLPFENISPEEDQDYFCDGMTEEIITDLSSIHDLFVISRNSAMTYKGTKKNTKEIGKELNVQYVLEGSVRKAGNNLRITAQLIEAGKDIHLWADKYSGTLDDVFDIQEKVSRSIVDKLKIRLRAQEKDQIIKRSTKNVDAYNLYLKGRYLINLISEDSFEIGLECFNQAIALDTGYALAYTGIAEYYIYIGWYSVISPEQAFEKAEGYVDKALELDNHLPEAHYDRAILKFCYEWDWDAAEKAFKYAMKLNPDNLSSFYYYSCYLVCMCRYDDAIKISKRMVELDPLSPVTNLILGWVYFEANRYADSIEQLRKVLELNPGFLIPQQEIAWNFAFQGMCKEALAEYEKIGHADMGIVWGDATRACVYALCGIKDEAKKTYDKMMKLAAQKYVDAGYFAAISAALGDKDKAFEWLQKAYKERSVLMVYLKNYAKSWFKNISSDPRFKEMLEKMGFEQ